MQSDYRSRPKERGGVVSFIVVALVLAGLFVGGIAIIKNRSEQTANPSPEVTQNTDTGSDEVAGDDAVAPEPTEADEEVTPAPTPAPAPQPTPSPITGGEIAATGPTETLMTMLILGLVAGLTTRYIQSRSRMIQQ